MTELQQAVHERVQHCIEVFNRTRFQFDKEVSVNFTIRGRVAGKAWGRAARVDFNNQLLERYGQEFITSTVDHEMAHLFAFVMDPFCDAHGWHWKEAMRILGHKEAERCHKYQVTPGRRTDKVTYQCKCGPVHKVSKTKHLAIQNGTVYCCNSCNLPITKAKMPSLSERIRLQKEQDNV